jgi:hypothetical protein
MERFLVDLKRIVITPISDILTAYISDKWKWASDMIKTSKNPFIMHKVQELSKKFTREASSYS